MTRRIFILLFLFLFSANAMAQDVVPRTVIRPQPTQEALINPGMGWTMHFYSNIPSNYGSKLEPSDSLEWFEGCSTVYLRLPWAYIEPEEGKFNWAILDTPAQRWISQGKQISLRITTSENWIEYATPQWVEKAGAKGVRYVWGEGPKENGPLWDPDYEDPVYVEKLRNLLAALGKRYNGNPSVAFIDVGTFGMWGEGHTHGCSQVNEEKTLKIVKQHIDMHCEFFPDTPLCISDDVIGHDLPGDKFPATDYAISKGVSLRDDSIMVQAPPRQWYHSELAQHFWPTMPVILEHEHYGGSKARGAWDGDRLVKSVEDYHASFMSIHWWPEEEWAECSDTIKKINLRLGYRLELREIAYPERVKIGEPFAIDWTWANVGVAPMYKGGFAAISLKDEKNGFVAVCNDDSFDLAELQPGEPGQAPENKHRSEHRVGYVGPTTRPGVYDVYVSVGKRDGTPQIVLPLENNDGQRRYKIGIVRLEM